MKHDPPSSSPRSYQGWLVSTSLIKRSLAVLGHMAIGHIVILLSAYLFAEMMILAAKALP